MNAIPLANPKKVLVIEPDDILRMTIQIWLCRTDYLVTHALKEPNQLGTILRNTHFDIVIIQADCSDISIQKLYLILLQYDVKIVFITATHYKLITKMVMGSNIVKTIKTPLTYQTLLHTLHQLTHPCTADHQ